MAQIASGAASLNFSWPRENPLALTFSFTDPPTLSSPEVELWFGSSPTTAQPSVAVVGDTIELSFTAVETEGLASELGLSDAGDASGRYVVRALVDGDGPFDLFAGAWNLTAPTVAARRSSSETVTIVAGEATITATINVGVGSGGGGGGAVNSVNGQTGTVVLTASDVGAQPSDSDLTAIAALSTTTYGRSLLTLADAAAGRSSLGLGTAATSNTSAFDAAGAAAAAQAASQPLDSDLTAIAALSTTSFGRSFLALADAAAARTLTGLVIGTNVQAYDAELEAIAGLTSAADRLPYFTGSGTAALATFTSAGRALVDDADAAAQRATLGVVIGTDVQAYDTDLGQIAALTRTKGDLIVGTSSAWTDLAVGTDGQVLTADSAQTAGVKWATPSGGGGDPNFALWDTDSGKHIAPGITAFDATQVVTVEQNYPTFIPLFIPRSCTVDRIMVEVTDTGSGRTAKFGLWTNGANGKPNTVVIDSGSVSTDTTGVKSVTISQALTAGVYWVGMYVSANTNVEGVKAQALVGINGQQTSAEWMLRLNNVAIPGGALPNTPTGFQSSAGGTNRAPYIRLRVA